MRKSTFGQVAVFNNANIQSLGCTLYAVAYGTSPFETDGGSIAMSVGSGRYRHPSSPYSDNLKGLIDAMLVVDPEKRPDIDKVGRVCPRR